jgi:outer membrane protein OmpA-like peptidoglycan-associated protein
MLLAVATSCAFAQNIDGKTVIGLHGGANMWFSDLYGTIPGAGGELMLRHGFNRTFSLGLVGGYEFLQAEADVPDHPQAGSTPYVKLDAFPVSLIGYFNLTPGNSFTASLYLGAGGMFYKRQNGDGTFLTEDKMYSTLHIPVGVAFEAFTSKKMSISFDLGYRVTDDYTDTYHVESSMPDGYATAKAGLNFYFGTSDSDDDDADGLLNGAEKKLGTNMKDPDTDKDALKDGDEVNVHKTDPLKADTDGDGLNDGDEMTKHKSDPLKADTDGDGLNDGDEVTKYKTDPSKADSDGDSLTDGAEVSMHRSNPMATDTDNDGLNDADEVNKHKTDPTKADTDGGTINDAAEVTRGTNPTDPNDDVVKIEIGKAMVLEGITFKTGSAEIAKESERALDSAYKTLQENPTIVVQVIGHTDNTGKRANNVKLSTRRADSVRKWLVNKGVDPARVSAVGKGPDQPIAPNNNKENRAKNRRIEFVRVK